MDEGDASKVLSPDALTRKVGPLPVWGYAVIVIVLVYGVRKYKAGKSPAPVTTAGAAAASDSAASGTVDMPTTATVSQADNSGASTNSASAYNPNGTLNGSGTSSTFASASTNADWLVQATAEVASLNSWGAYQIDAALRAYLSGSALDASQQPIVSTAIKMVGSPPEAVAPAPSGAYAPVVTPAVPIVPAPPPVSHPPAGLPITKGTVTTAQHQAAIPSMYAVNSNRLDHKLAPWSVKVYLQNYPHGVPENGAQDAYIRARAAQPGAIAK